MVKRKVKANISFDFIKGLPTIGDVKRMAIQTDRIVKSPKAPSDKIVDKGIAKFQRKTKRRKK
jgi:hypothetical protein